MVYRRGTGYQTDRNSTESRESMPLWYEADGITVSEWPLGCPWRRCAFLTPSKGVGISRECGTPSEGVQRKFTAKSVLWVSLARGRAPYSFRRSRAKAENKTPSEGVGQRRKTRLLPKEWGKCGKHDSFRRSGAKAENTTPSEGVGQRRETRLLPKKMCKSRTYRTHRT